MKIVIVAGGLASRLYPLTAFIPKFLINTGKQAGLIEQLKYWKEFGAETVRIITHPKFIPGAKAYVSMYDIGVDIEFKEIERSVGSADAIMTTCHDLVGEDVIFMWCDILPEQQVSKEALHEVTVYTNETSVNRCHFANGKIIKTPEDVTGNVFGMYRVKNFQLTNYADGQDFVDVLGNLGHMGSENVESLKDWGDIPKLKALRAGADKAREFNTVKFNGDIVRKEATNEKGKALIEKELAWYAKIGTTNFTPKIISQDQTSFEMERIKGCSVWEAARSPTSTKPLEYYARGVLELQHHLHNSVAPLMVTGNIVVEDIKAEVSKKLLSRFKIIEPYIRSFGNISSVNGVQIKKENEDILDAFVAMVNKIENLIIDATVDGNLENSFLYSFIHGDLQMSNSMITEDENSFFAIDPRGYFGNTANYGLPEYDESKLLYSLYGYDVFNYSSDAHITDIENGNISFQIPVLREDPAEFDFMSYLFADIHMYWLSVIFLGLSEYIKNDPVKCVMSFYHGMAIGTLTLNLGDYGGLKV